jgi:hypothetical protein
VEIWLGSALTSVSQSLLSSSDTNLCSFDSLLRQPNTWKSQHVWDNAGHMGTDVDVLYVETPFGIPGCFFLMVVRS